MKALIIAQDTESKLDWPELTETLKDGEILCPKTDGFGGKRTFNLERATGKIVLIRNFLKRTIDYIAFFSADQNDTEKWVFTDAKELVDLCDREDLYRYTGWTNGARTHCYVNLSEAAIKLIIKAEKR